MKKLFCIVLSILFLSSCTMTAPNLDASKPIFASSIPSIGSSEKLEVIMATPQSKVFDEDNLQAIVVSFNQPMVPLTVIDSETAVNLKIEPHVSGKYRWLGSATLSFIPSRPLKGSAYKVTVPAGTKSLSGKTLDKDYTWRFDALPPALTASYPNEKGKHVAKNAKLLLNFNQPIDPVLAEKSIRLEKVNGKSLETCNFKLLKFDENKKIIDLVPLATDEMLNWNKKNILVISPSEPLEINSKYVISLSSDLKNKSGGLLLGSEQKITFETEKKFAYSYIKNSDKVEPEDLLEISFTNPVRAKDFFEHTKFSPEVKASGSLNSVNDISDKLSLYLNLKAGTKYTLTFDKEFKDVNGNLIAENSIASFTTSDFKPRVYIPEGNGIVESGTDRIFPIKFINMENIHMTALSIDKNDIVEFVKYRYDRKKMKNKIMASPSLIDENIKLNAERNKEGLYPLKLDRVLKNGKGVAFLDFHELDAKTDGGNVNETGFYNGIVQVTNLAITAKLSYGNGLIWVTSLDKGLPVKDVNVEIRDDSNSVLWRGKTGADGSVLSSGFVDLTGGRFNGDRPQFYVIAEKNGDISYLTPDWDWSCGGGWNFNIDSQMYWGEKIYKSSIFTEKGLYSPGSRVLIKGIIREKKNGKWIAPKSGDFLIKIQDSRGNYISEKQVKLSTYGSFDFQYDLSPNAPTGEYLASLYEKKAKLNIYLMDKDFLVQEYKSADYSVDVSIPNKTYIYGDSITAKYSAKWLFDAPVKGAKSNWSIIAEPYSFSPEGYETYSFSPESYEFADDGYIPIAEGEGKLDNQGFAEMSAKLENAMIKSSVKANVTATVISSANASISNTASFVLHRGKFYIGSRVNTFAISEGKAQKISLVALTPDLKPLADMQLTTDILKCEWDSVRKETLGEGTSWVSVRKDKKVKTLQNVLSKGKAEFDFTPQESGYYVARTTAKDSIGNEIISESSFYVFGGGYVSWARSNDDMIELVKDKKSYKAGEKAKIIIKSPYKTAKAMITVEKDYIVSRKFIDVNGSAFAFDVPVTDKDFPGIFVSVVLVQGRSASVDGAKTDVGKPSYKIGYIEIPVKSESQKLKVSVSPDKTKYEPGETAKLKVKLTDSKGNGVRGEVVLAVVDNGVLSLINYKLPDLFDMFYGKNTLFVESFDTRRNVIGQRNYGEKGESDGGGGGESLPSLARKNFKDTAYWNPSLITDKDGNAQVSFELPDNLTTFSIMSVAYTSESFSSGDKTEIVTSKPLLLKEALPSFAFVNDRLSGGVTVFNGTGEMQNVEVSLNAEEIFVDGVNKKSVSVPAGGEKTVYFDLVAKKSGTAILTFSALGKGSSDSIACALPIKVGETLLETVSSFAASQDMIYNEEISLPDSVVPDVGSLSLTLSSSLFENLKAPMNFLTSYPYECLEQRVSRVIPMLSSKELAVYCGLSDEKIKENTRELLGKLPAFQTIDGGFALWSGSGQSSEYLSCYTMELLSLSRKQNYAFDKAMYEKGMAYLKELSKKPINKAWGNSYSESEKYFLKNYALYVIYLGGDKDVTSLNVMSEKTSQLDSLSMAYLMKTLKIAGGNDSLISKLKTEILNSLKLENSFAFFTTPKGYESYLLYSSDTKSTALIMSALLDYADTPNLEKIAIYLRDKIKDTKTLNTHDSSFVISALDSYFTKVEKNGSNDFFASIRLGGKELVGSKLSAPNNSKIAKTVELKDLMDKDERTIRFEKNGAGIMYCTSILTYMPVGKIPARSQGMTLLRKIEALSGDKDSGENFKAGQIYKVTVSLITPIDRTYVVVHEPVPAGFAAVNTNFSTENPVLANIMENLKLQRSEMKNFATFNNEEFYSDKVLIFADNLSKGEHTYTYLLRAVNPGVYSVNPSKAFMMYYPEVFASTDSGDIVIK